MMQKDAMEQPVDRIAWLERSGGDFPYYKEDSEYPISGNSWWLVLIGVAAGFFTLIFTQPVFPTGLLGFIPSFLYFLVPFAVLGIAARSGAWKSLFRRIRPIDWLLMILFFVLNYIATILFGTIAISLFETSSNPVGNIIAAASMSERVIFFAKAAVQLLGEEVFTILPFLAILFWLTAKVGMSRGKAVFLAALGTSLIFAAAHLPTYQWHVPQAFIGLVPVRMILLLPYIMTKNIWVSTGTHVINDWVIFGLPLLVGSGAE